jgi:hypothetical protein
MTQTIYSKEIQAVLDTLLEITDLTPAQTESISNMSKHCLELAIFDTQRLKSQALTSISSKVSFGELYQEHLTKGYEELSKLINKIDATTLKTTPSMTIAQAEEKLDSIKKKLEQVIQAKKGIIEQLNQLAEEEVKSPTALKLGAFDNEEKFKIALNTYATSMRALTNKLVLTCPIYPPKTAISSSKDKTVDDVIKEMTAAFFEVARDQGYNLEECVLTIGEKQHTFSDLSSSDQSKYSSEAKAYAAKLLAGSHIGKESYFDESMTKDQQAKLKEILQSHRKAAVTAAGRKPKSAVDIKGSHAAGGATVEGTSLDATVEGTSLDAKVTGINSKRRN